MNCRVKTFRFTHKTTNEVRIIEGKVVSTNGEYIMIDTNDHIEHYNNDAWVWSEIDLLYYIYVQSAEEDSASVVQLNREQWELVNKVCSLTPFTGGGFCGSSYISCRGYVTEDEAIEAYHDGSFNDPI